MAGMLAGKQHTHDIQAWRVLNKEYATIFTRRSGWEKGSERSNTAFTMLKIAVFPPTPKASESTAAIAKPDSFRALAARAAFLA